MSSPIIFLLASIPLAFVIALWEIQIEGVDGWAAKLPTRRWQNTWTKIFFGGRPLTGYHLGLTTTLLLLIHFPAMFTAWSWRVEAAVIGFYLVMITLEDFLWFVFNPAWGIRKFKKSPQLWWHPRWFLGLPDFYWFAIPLGVLLVFLSAHP